MTDAHLAGAVLAADVALAVDLALETAGAGTAVGLWLARLTNYVATTLTVGFLLVPAWIAGTRGDRATRIASAMALLWGASGVALLVFGMSNAAARPLPEALDADLLRRFLATRFGAAVSVQAAVTLVLGLATALLRHRAAPRALLAVALLAAAGPAWWGHAGTADARAVALASDWFHVMGAAAWLGGLVALIWLIWRSDPGSLGPPARRFSTLAGWAFGVVAVTGIVNTTLHVSEAAQLVDTRWGRLALGKAAVLVLVGAIGWWHRRRTLTALDSGGPPARRAFLRVAGAEVALLLVAIGLATTMASGMPADAEAAGRIQSVTTALGDGQVSVTIDPARVGPNELHLFVFGPDGSLRDVGDVHVTLTPLDTPDGAVEPRLFFAGPGHFTALGMQVPTRGGYELEVLAEIEGRTERATATVELSR